jgi:hypothetical protein
MRRLEDKRAKKCQNAESKVDMIYDSMDMTAGCHQTPIAAESRIFTAFITFMGVFQ